MDRYRARCCYCKHTLNEHESKLGRCTYCAKALISLHFLHLSPIAILNISRIMRKHKSTWEKLKARWPTNKRLCFLCQADLDMVTLTPALCGACSMSMCSLYFHYGYDVDFFLDSVKRFGRVIDIVGMVK